MNDEQKAQIITGDDAETFVSSELGKAVLELVRQEADAAILDFKDADLKDDKLLRDLQNRIWRATQFEGWLSEIITRGREVMQSLKED